MNFVLIGGIAVCVWAVLLTLSGERMRQFQSLQAKLRVEAARAAEQAQAAKTGVTASASPADEPVYTAR